MLSPNLPWPLANPKWAAEINPIVSNPFCKTAILKGVKLLTGNNIINHSIGQTQQGWVITDIQGVASIYRNAPFNNLTLSLHSSADVTVDIGVF